MTINDSLLQNFHCSALVMQFSSSMTSHLARNYANVCLNMLLTSIKVSELCKSVKRFQNKSAILDKARLNTWQSQFFFFFFNIICFYFAFLFAIYLTDNQHGRVEKKGRVAAWRCWHRWLSDFIHLHLQSGFTEVSIKICVSISTCDLVSFLTVTWGVLYFTETRLLLSQVEDLESVCA